MKRANLVWDDENLHACISDPQGKWHERRKEH
jgi:hypothetical protein